MTECDCERPPGSREVRLEHPEHGAKIGWLYRKYPVDEPALIKVGHVELYAFVWEGRGWTIHSEDD